MQARHNFSATKVSGTTEVFPQAVVADNLIFISGTTGIDPLSGKLSDSFEEQTLQAFMNIKIILEELGGSLDKIVKTTVFMISGNDFSILNKVYSQVFEENAPAGSTPQVVPFPAVI